MRLQKLHINNFKGLKNFTFDTGGQSATVFGQNETGKTTLFDALTWLLTGKDSRDRSPDNFGIKTRDADGEVIHGLDHEVEGVFDCFTLRRVYQEKWTRKRGAANETFSGHTTDYFIDDEPVKASDYQEAVEQVMPERLLKILTMPDYFPEQMHWKERREVLFDLVGEIDTEDIILNYGDLERYPAVLDGKTHEAREKILKEQRRKLGKELDNIPGRIDELNGRLYEKVGDVEEAKNTVTQLKSKKGTIEAKRSEVKSGGRIAELKVEKQELEAEKRKAENKFEQILADDLKELREKVSVRQDSVDEIQSKFREAKREYQSLSEKVKDALKTVIANNTDIKDIKDREPKPANAFEPEKCPVCEQTMPDADEHDYEAYLQEFNQEKAQDLKSARETHGRAKEKHVELKGKLESAKQEASNIKGKLNQRQQALEKAQTALKEAKNNQTSFHDSDQYEAITDKIDEIDEKIANHRQEKQAQLEDLDGHISAIDEEIEQAQQTIHKAKENQRTHERIAELQEEHKGIAKQLGQAEADIHLMEEFVRARSAYVTDKVNEKFEHVTWKLFEEQINGGISETCTAVFKGVPFDEGLNNAGRIQAGLDIINTLSGHYDKAAPVFIDNAEGITDIPDYDLQIIALVVTSGMDTLHVEQGLENHLEVPHKSLAAV